jgi:hypothetical protein
MNRIYRYLTFGLVFALYGCGGGSNDSGVNNPPDISGTATTYARAGELYQFSPLSSDPETDRLTFSVTNKPPWLDFDENSGTLQGIPDESNAQQQFDDIVITVSDGEFSVPLEAFSIRVMYSSLGRKNVTLDPAATVTDTPDGYDLVGDASIKVGDLVTEFKDADLQFEYDEEGNLLDMTGTTLLPPVISDNLLLNASVNTIVGMYTGAEINASLDIGPESEPGILVRDEFKYLVYFIDAAVDLTFTDKNGTEFPFAYGLAGFRTLIISDPTDPFFYMFGDTAAGSIGYGNSFNSNIPYQPLFDPSEPVAFSPLEPFFGSETVKGIIPVSAFKVFDVFEITGTAVCNPPQLLPCGQPSASSLVSSAIDVAVNGLDPTQQMTIGMNGTAALKFTVLGVDLFEYHLLDMAAMLDLGNTREHLALQAVIDTAESSSPDWLPIKPVPDLGVLMVGNLFADADPITGDGDFGISLYGEFPSTFPAATINGSIDINQQGLQMVGKIPDPDNPIVVTATVDDKELAAGIEFGYDFQKNINGVVNDSVDRALARVDKAYNDLQAAIGNYDIAFSLNGLRSQIPTIVDTLIPELNAIPQKVYDKVYSETLNGINSTSYTYKVSDLCKIYGGSCPVYKTIYAKSFVDEVSIAKNAATDAKNTAQGIVNARVTELNTLRTESQQATDPQFQQGLKTALETVAAHDKVSVTVKVTKTVDYVVTSKAYTFYNNTLTYTVFDAPTKASLEAAAVYAGEIDPDYQIKLNTQQIFDALPTKDQINQVAQDVQDGIVDVPVIKGGGYTVMRTGEQSAYILLGNDKIDIAFNPLDPKAAIDGVGDLIVDYLTQ